ncbi:MAG: hypothetical protein K0S56_570 [Microvirga sp.]|nr:hypothetical protein [Microvirga sp.]
MRNKQTTALPRRPLACSVTDRLRRRPGFTRKAGAEVVLGAPGALRRLLNGAPVRITDPDILPRLRAVRASELSRAGALSELFLDDLDGAELAARFARRFYKEAA